MIDRMLAEARSRIPRYTPGEAAAADVLLVQLGVDAGGFEAWVAAGLPVER